MKISEYPPPPPPDSHCLGTSTTTGRVSLCTISIQQTMCAYAKFSHLRKRISNIFKCYPTKNIENPL